MIKTIEGNEGDDLLSLAHEHDIDLEGEWAPRTGRGSGKRCGKALRQEVGGDEAHDELYRFAVAGDVSA